MKLLTFILIVLTYSGVSQSIFTCEYKYQSDITVKVVNYKHEADLLVYRSTVDYNTKGNKGVWYFTDTKYTSDISVQFVKYKYQADLTIYYVRHSYEAGWRNKNKKYLIQTKLISN